MPQQGRVGHSRRISINCRVIPWAGHCPAPHSLLLFHTATASALTGLEVARSPAKPRHPPGTLPCSARSLLPLLTDALVHVCIAKAEVSQWTRWQANPDLPDVIPLQKDEEFGGTSQAPVELRAQVAASGTALTQLGANWKSKREAAVRAARPAGLCTLQLRPQSTGTAGRGAGRGLAEGCGSWRCFSGVSQPHARCPWVPALH